MSQEQLARIRALNDRFRTTFIGGRVMITEGVRALGQDAVSAIREKVETFNDFNGDNDPYGEHDFAAVAHEGEKVFWKIDYYNNTMDGHSLDPSDTSQTVRVLTIMLASEY